MRQDQRDLEQLVEVQQRRHPAEDAGAPPVGSSGMAAVATTRSWTSGTSSSSSMRSPWILMIFDSDRDHAVLGLVGGIAHLGVGQDRQIVELDAVVLAVLDQQVDALARRIRRSRRAGPGSGRNRSRPCRG